jgi:hypothetical protein
MKINEEDIKKYYNEFIKPHITLDFIQKTMLIPYLSKEILNQEYPEIANKR